MIEVTYWLQALGDGVLRCCTVQRKTPEIQAVRFVRGWDGPDDNALWVGQPDELHALLQQGADLRGQWLFLTADEAEAVDAACRLGAHVVTTRLELIALHERLSAALRQWQRWSLRLLEAAGNRHSIQDVVDAAATLAGGALFLLNAGGRMAYFGGRSCGESALATQLLERGSLPQETLALLLPETVHADEPVLCSAMGSRGKCWGQRVFKQNSLISFMLLFVPATCSDGAARALMQITRENVSRAAAAADHTYWAGGDFRQLLDDIMTGRVAKEEEIASRFSRIARTPQQFCSFIIIESAVSGRVTEASSPLMAQLEAIFPDSNAALYEGGVVLLLSRPDRDFQPAPVFDRARFDALLARYDACAAISNATSKREMLRTNYLLTKSVLQLGRALRPDSGQRIFFFEEYAEYVMIDLCIQSFSALLGHDDIIYLTHPEAVQIYRYDQQNNTNLLDVLYYYCLKNCSISQASKASYMHRNTFSARLAKLQELIKADLENGEIQQRMMFSYKILRYYGRYAKVNLKKRLEVTGGKKEKDTDDGGRQSGFRGDI